MIKRRKTKQNRVLKDGEWQRPNGTYCYRWRTSDHKRHVVYSKTLDELRQKEQEILMDVADNIRTESKNVTLNGLYNTFIDLKKHSLKDNVYQNYKYCYMHFVYNSFLGGMRIVDIKASDILKFYVYLIDSKGLSYSSVENVHVIVRQILEIAKNDDITRKNVSEKALVDLRKSHNNKPKVIQALTLEQQKALIKFLSESNMYRKWLLPFVCQIGLFCRINELLSLTWNDVSFENNTVSINKTLHYYQHEDGKCGYSISVPKTKNSIRTIPLIMSVKEALLEERERQKRLGLKCKTEIDGYSNFIFLNNKNQEILNEFTFNRALHRIQSAFRKENPDFNIQEFSSHALRHTGITNLISSKKIGIKTVQILAGHSSIDVTMNIYCSQTESKILNSEMDDYNNYIQKEMST